MTGEATVRVTLGDRPKNIADGRWRSIYDEARRDAVREGGMYLFAQMVPRIPVASGNLRSSTRLDVHDFDAFVGPAGAPSLYAYFADQGRKPGRMPPIEAIAYWTQRKRLNLNPYLVARSIARKGTKGAHFVGETARAHGGTAAELMAAKLREGIARI